jgi:hypothetical protein
VVDTGVDFHIDLAAMVDQVGAQVAEMKVLVNQLVLHLRPGKVIQVVKADLETDSMVAAAVVAAPEHLVATTLTITVAAVEAVHIRR